MPGPGRLGRPGRRLAVALWLLAGAAGAMAATPREAAREPVRDQGREQPRDPIRDQTLFRISSIDAGILAFDVSIVELTREPRVSELRVHGFNARSEAGSRWLMCMFNTLAILRGFDYWTAVYPAGDDEIVLVGFPPGPRDKMADIDPRFASRWAMGVVAPIDRGVRLCKRTGA